MRIAQLVSLEESVPPRGKNGLEHMVYYLTEELVRRGHEVTLFATHDSVTSARLVEIMPYPRSKGVLFDMTSTHYAFTVAAKAVEMSEEFDVIHSHLGAPAYYFADLSRAPIVETVHSAASFILRGEEDGEMEKYIIDRRRRLDHMRHVFVSRSQEKNSGLSKNSSVVHNGISFRDFTFRPDAGGYFAYLGYITPEKGAHLAVRAAQDAGVKLKLAGSYYGCEEYFAKEIEPYLKGGQIEYAGVLDPSERDRFLGNAKALLFPIEWEEPFGLVMIEAMACGTPVIGLNRASVPEVVKEGESGFVVDDPAGMQAAMGRIDEIDRAACRRYVETYFSVERMADEYEKIYGEVIMERERR